MSVIDSGTVWTTAGPAVVAASDCGLRDSPTSVVLNIAGVTVRLHPAEAHELGTKLRRMARKARS